MTNFNSLMMMKNILKMFILFAVLIFCYFGLTDLLDGAFMEISVTFSTNLHNRSFIVTCKCTQVSKKVHKIELT